MLLPSLALAADPDLQARYAAGDESQRVDLLDRIGRSADPLEGQEEVLLLGLADASDHVQRRAALALAAKGQGIPRAVDMLLRSLSDENAGVRAAAAFALGRLAPESVEVAKALAEHVTDSDAAVRRASIMSLRLMRVDRELVRPVLWRALETGDPAVVAAALQTFASLGVDVIDDLKRALAHDEANYWASLVIQEMGPVAADTVEPLRQVLRSQEPEERLQAILALAAIGPKALPASGDLAAILKTDEFEGARFAAAYALGRMGAKGVADDELKAAARSDSPILRLVGAWSLAELYPADERLVEHAVDTVFASIQSDDPLVSRMAARALVESKLPYEQTAPLAIAALEASSPQAVDSIIEALATQGKKALPRIKLGLADEKLQMHALRVVQRIGPEAAELLPSVTPLLSSDDPDLRREALYAIASIGPDASASAEILLEAYLKEEVRQNRLAAIYAAGQFGSASAAFVPYLKELAAQVDDLQARVAALWALTRIAPDDPVILAEAIPAMVDALNQAERPVIKLELVRTLGELGIRAKAAAPAIEALLYDYDSRVREAARKALEKIGEREPLSRD